MEILGVDSPALTFPHRRREDGRQGSLPPLAHAAFSLSNDSAQPSQR